MAYRFFMILFIILLFGSMQPGWTMQEPVLLKDNEPERNISFSAFPFLMYDSDIGFGFGGKIIIKNLLKSDESFDLVLFGSTKGEQWYILSFSIPDSEIRQGTAFPLALDLKLEYDKILKSNFFGFGNNSNDNEWQFPKRFVKFELTIGRGLTRSIITEARFVYNNTSVYDYDSNIVLTPDVPGTGEHTIPYFTGRIRWDTRDNQNHPHRGWNLSLSADLASESFFSDYTFQRYRLEANKYQQLFSPSHVLATRLWLQHIEGTAPYYEQSIIGGGSTARGFKADRFIDRAFTLASLEYRIIVYKGFGGVLFTDAGRVYPSLEEISLEDWHISYGGGLRYYLSNFVVGFDTGFSKEGMRLFFNFGHVF